MFAKIKLNKVLLVTYSPCTCESLSDFSNQVASGLKSSSESSSPGRGELQEAQLLPQLPQPTPAFQSPFSRVFSSEEHAVN